MTPALPGPPPRRRARWVAPVAIAVVVVIVAVAAWAAHEAGRYYTYQPGTAPLLTTSSSCRLRPSEGELVLPDGKPCVRLTVPSGRAHTVKGRLFMVDVLVGRANPVEYLLGKVGLLDVFEHGTALVPAVEVLGGAPATQLTCEDDQEMAGATAAAPVAALRWLGDDVRTVQHGAEVFEVAPDTPASRAGVDCGDVITGVDGRAVHTAEQLVTAIRSYAPGTAVGLTVERTGAGGHLRTLTLHATLGSVPAEDGAPAEPHTAFLGVAIEDDTTYTLPFDVSIDVGDIGGPSAGLALTLGLLDVLSGGGLTGGHDVAATGTISADGAVGEVGGVAQKAVAITRAGATLFLVPTAELSTAKRHVGPHVKVEAVSTLGQALADLRAIGGHVPAQASTASS